MTFSRLKRLPKRIIDDLKIIRLAVNWREILWAKLKHVPLTSIRLRNGVVLTSPKEVSLNFLFHEIWLEKFYAPNGYEIREGEIVVDIGANIAVFATWAATRAPNVKVISYEPFPANAEYFQVNRELSKLENIEFHEAAVGESAGKRTLNVSDSWILHSLAEKNADATGIEVECTTLDEALAGSRRCDFLKLDCEGGEYEILYSAAPETIAKIGRVVCEFNVLDENERNGEGLKRFFTANSFRVDELRALDVGSGYICAKRK
jgi:FkbM family methyltransferase